VGYTTAAPLSSAVRRVVSEVVSDALDAAAMVHATAMVKRECSTCHSSTYGHLAADHADVARQKLDAYAGSVQASADV
jgi:hypothetical protein